MWLFIADDGGFTSIGVMVATMLVCSLLFSASQVSWVESNAADIQDAADAGALAADNVVAEYMVVARVTDATVLSMSLLGLALYAVGAVAACIPVADVAAEPVLALARQVMQARDAFARAAISSLTKLQKMLPFMCAVNASEAVIASGHASSLSASYGGIAIAVPLMGEEVDLPDDAASDEAASTVDEGSPTVSDDSRRADEARREANEAKKEGYAADCGPGTSMRERASALAGLGGSSNPWFASADLWSFDAPLARARSYYAARIVSEAPEHGGIEELTRSIARERFYRYAHDKLGEGYVTTDSRGVTTAYLPFLPEDTDDIRGTVLYSEDIWPVSNEGGMLIVHASAQCPGCSGQCGTAAVCDIDSGAVAECPVCGFSASTLGHVPSASTSIDNGFEHYYRACARAAERYSEASRRYADASEEAKKLTEDSLDAFGKALKELGKTRFDPKPPGRFGCICIAFDTSTHCAPSVLAGFAGTSAVIGPRAAISAAMLAPDSPEEGANVVSSLLAGVEAEGNADGAVDLASGVISLWGNLLFAYLNGTTALEQGIEDILSNLPLVGSDELSSWAKKKLVETIELIGLEPVKMESLKPVLVNSADVLEADASGVGDRILGVKRAYTSMPGSGSGTIAGSMLDGIAAIVGGREDDLDEGAVIAHIKLFEGGPSFDIKVRLPEGLSDKRAVLATWISDCARALDAAIVGGDVAWG